MFLTILNLGLCRSSLPGALVKEAGSDTLGGDAHFVLSTCSDLLFDGVHLHPED